MSAERCTHQRYLEDGAAIRSVAAVVVTYNRHDTLRRTLLAVREQQRPPDKVFVVDNCSTDDTEAMVKREFPRFAFMRLPDNQGFGAGLAAGMQRGYEQGYDYFWLLDDDSRPASAALERSLAVVSSAPKVGIVGLWGNVSRWGVPRPGAPLETMTAGAANVYRCDYLLLDGSVVSRQVVETVGYPRADFFMMMEDFEYTGRAKRAGWDLALLLDDLIERSHLGSSGAHNPPWRAYYQARNHLLIAMEHRSVSEVIGWLLRQVRVVSGAIVRRDQPLEQIRLRLLGAWHACRGVKGKTIDPAQYARGRL